MCSNQGDKVVLGECLKLSVLLKMNADQFTLDGFELLFFFNNIYIFRGVQIFVVFRGDVKIGWQQLQPFANGCW